MLLINWLLIKNT